MVQAALSARHERPSVGIRDLLGPDWYHRDVGPVYSVGGAFVEFLIRTHGVAKFLRFYNECRPEAVEATCRAVFGADLNDLEDEFWEDARRQREGSLAGSDGP